MRAGHVEVFHVPRDINRVARVIIVSQGVVLVGWYSTMGGRAGSCDCDCGVGIGGGVSDCGGGGGGGVVNAVLVLPISIWVFIPHAAAVV